MSSGRRRAKVNSGLHIVPYKRPGKPTIWYIYAYRGGPRIHDCEGARPVVTEEILQAAFEAKRKKPRGGDQILDRLIFDYRSSPEFTTLSDRTQKDYRVELDKLSVRWGSAPLAVFDDRRMREDILTWRDERANTPRTADKGIVMLSTLLGWAVVRGRLTLNVAHGIPLLYRVNRADKVWSEADFAAIKPHCSTELDWAIRFASLTGFRLGDLVKVGWDDIGGKGIIYTTSKKTRRVVVPVFPELRDLLAEIGASTGTILKNSRSAAWTESGLGGVFQKAKAKAQGFDTTLRLHDLRGTYATWLANMGVTDQEIGRIIAWKETRVAEIRLRYIDEARVVASLVERLSKQG